MICLCCGEDKKETKFVPLGANKKRYKHCKECCKMFNAQERKIKESKLIFNFIKNIIKN